MQLNQLQMDWRAAVAVIASTLLLIFDAYRTLFRSELWTRALLYLVIPLLIIVLVFRESPAEYGFRLGDWKAGLALTVAGCAFMTLVLAIIARTGAFSRYYGRIPNGQMPFWLADGIELLGWEFFFRGFLLFALYRCCGPIALFLQAVPFALAHIGKPELETLSCIFGGAAFGYVAWRTRSALYPFLIHWFQAVLATLIASGAFG